MLNVMNKNGEIFKKKITIRFIDTCRFMPSSLSSLVDNLAGVNTNGIICKECKGEMEFIGIDHTYNGTI